MVALRDCGRGGGTVQVALKGTSSASGDESPHVGGGGGGDGVVQQVQSRLNVSSVDVLHRLLTVHVQVLKVCQVSAATTGTCLMICSKFKIRLRLTFTVTRELRGSHCSRGISLCRSLARGGPQYWKPPLPSLSVTCDISRDVERENQPTHATYLKCTNSRALSCMALLCKLSFQCPVILSDPLG